MTRRLPSRLAPLLLLTTAAAIPRVLGAMVRPPWHDEYFTAWAASLSLGGLLDALRLDSGPPLPYLLAKLLSSSGLAPLTAARLLSVVAGTLAVLLVALAARRAFGERAGWWCGALLAVHPLAVAWSCEGRAYAILLLAAAWSWERIEAIATTGRGAWWLAPAIALACWSHALGLVLAAAVLLAALTLRPELRRPSLAALGLGLATHIPWLPVAAAQPAGAIAWMAHDWASQPLPDRLLAPLRYLSPLAPFFQRLDLPAQPPATEIAGALLCIAVLSGATRALRPLLMGAFPLVALTILAWLGTPVLYPGRSEALVIAPFVGLLASGATRTRWRSAAALALVVAATLLTGLALGLWWRQPPRLEQRMAAVIESSLPAGGTVVVGGHWYLDLAFHLGGVAGDYVLVPFPAANAAHPGWYDDGSDGAAPEEMGNLQARLAVDRSAGRAVAVVVPQGLHSTPELRALATSLRLPALLTTRECVIFASPTPRQSRGRQ